MQPVTGSISTVNLREFEEVEVTASLKKIKLKMTTGPDEIPAFLLKDCACILTYPLKILFNLCLRNYEIPRLWKRSKVCPIFEKFEKLFTQCHAMLNTFKTKKIFFVHFFCRFKYI